MTGNRFKSFKSFLALLVACHLSLVTALMMPINTPGQQETPPPPAPPRPFNFPKPAEKTLANGLRVIFVERPGTSLATAQVLIKNGGEVDPPKLAGLADMTASLLTKGTTKRSAPQIAEAVEALGGMIDYGARWDASQVSVNVASAQLDPAMEILSDVVRHPTFKDDELERQRQQSIDMLSFMLVDPGQLARYVASRVVFGDSPYGHPLNGTPESLALMKRDDITRLHSAYYRPDNALLVIGGDLRAEEAFKLAERYFGDWAKPSTPLSANNQPAISYRRTSGQRVVVVDMEHAGQAAVILTREGLKRTDPDFFRGIVANSVLGGGFSSRLSQEIRMKRGLSYGAASALEVRRSAGPFVAVTQTKNESGAEVASLLLTELARMSSASIPDTELTPRKAALIGSYARQLETIDGLVTQVASLALYGLSLDEINNYIKNVQAVQAAEIQKFAGTRLDAKTADIIIVGKASDFLPDLRKRFKNVEVIPESELDLNSAGLRKTGGGGAASGGSRMK
jgi:zinc protease